ncbi:aquaporin [Actinomadura sp. HBU206391]|uniref:aquaporin n=1 Tax=Actinomadura sp. HBU206391 TaxID=2731692 RepID=UPI00164F291B|nr:aquaporin [Actinomadura sp. HBU206391]
MKIALLGPRSGGSIDPARQFGPAALSGQTTDLWIYLVAYPRLRTHGHPKRRVRTRAIQPPRFMTRVTIVI